jgi:hypothetical protein
MLNQYLKREVFLFLQEDNNHETFNFSTNNRFFDFLWK